MSVTASDARSERVVFGPDFCESGERSEPDEVKRWIYSYSIVAGGLCVTS